MTNVKAIRFTVAVLALVLMPGCSLQYNGAWGLGSKRHSSPSPDATATAGGNGDGGAAATPLSASASSARPAPAQAQPTTPQAAAFEEPSAAAQQAALFNTVDGPNGATQFTAQSLAPLGLYGQLSPNDPASPDSPGEAGNLERVTFTTEGSDFDPQTDPTGQWLAYASTRHRKTADIYLKRIGGSTITQLTNDPANDVMPAFSPDGKRIAYASDRSGNWDIYIMDVQGGQSVQVTNDPTHDIHPSFSPDGKWIVYCSYGAQSNQWELVLADVDNPATRKIIGPGLFPSWSPVDNRIVFQRARQRGTRWFSIWTVDMVNGEASRPTEIAASSNAAAITPQWSPDGRHIVFSTVVNPQSSQQTRPSQADIWVIAADGTGRANLTHSPFANLQPVWCSDGRVYFVSNRNKDSVENIWAIHPDRALMVARGRSPGPAPATAAQVPPAAPTDNKAAVVPTP